MLSLSRLLTLRSLRARPMRMLLSTFGIVLGVAAILAISITNQTAMLSVTRLFQETSGKANLIITNTETDADGFSEKILPRLETYRGVQAAVPSLHLQTLLANEVLPSQLGLTFFGENVGGLTLYGIDPASDSLARDYKIVEGVLLSGGLNADEVVLVKDYASENEVKVETGWKSLRVER